MKAGYKNGVFVTKEKEAVKQLTQKAWSTLVLKRFQN